MKYFIPLSRFFKFLCYPEGLTLVRDPSYMSDGEQHFAGPMAELALCVAGLGYSSLSGRTKPFKRDTVRPCLVFSITRQNQGNMAILPVVGCQLWPGGMPYPFPFSAIRRVASGQGKVRENNSFSRSVKSQGISPKVREFCNFLKSHGKVREFCRAALVVHDSWAVISLKKQI